jgi:hypothetical protein
VRTAGGTGAWAQIKRAIGAIGEWFARREATEDEKAARLRDAQRSRHLRT